MEPPPGGDEDEIPPWITGVFPGHRSVGNSVDLRGVVEFSEWIDEKLSPDAIRISPPLEKSLRIKALANRVYLTSRTPLDTGTTYTLVFSTQIKDLHNQAMKAPFTLVFSTGAALDTLELEGRISHSAGTKVGSGNILTVALYPLGSHRTRYRYLQRTVTDSSGADSLIPIDSLPSVLEEKPFYTTTTDSTGAFHFVGLKAGRYRLLAFADRNYNGLPDLGQEDVALGERDPEVGIGNAPEQLQLGRLDTSSLLLTDVSILDKERILVNLNRHPYPSDSTKMENFALLRADSTPVQGVQGLYVDPQTSMPVLRVVDLQRDSLYIVRANGLTDSLGRSLDSLRNWTSFTWLPPVDTFPTQIVRTLPRNGSKNLPQESTIRLDFSRDVAAAKWRDEFLLDFEGDTLAYELRQVGPLSLELLPVEKLSTNARIRLFRIRPDTVIHRDSNGVTDTVVEPSKQRIMEFRTYEALKKSMLSGKIPGGGIDTRVDLREAKGNRSWTTQCDSAGAFRFENLAEGNYFISWWWDLDASGVRSPGSLFPWSFPEPSRVLTDTLHLPRGDDNRLEDLIKNLPTPPRIFEKVQL